MESVATAVQAVLQEVTAAMVAEEGPKVASAGAGLLAEAE